MPAAISRPRPRHSSGVAEVVPRALRSDFGDAEELAAKIVALLSLPGLRDSQVAAGAEALRGLTWRAAGARCAAIYEELVGEGPGAFASGRIAGEP